MLSARRELKYNASQRRVTLVLSPKHYFQSVSNDIMPN